MEDNFYNDDGFEDFLQTAIKNHRMYPSDSIWRNIHKKLHGDTNWPALTIVGFTFLAIIIAFSFYFSPSPDFFSVTEYNKALLQVKEQKSFTEKRRVTLLNKQNISHKNQVIPFVQNGVEPNDIPDVTEPADIAPTGENIIANDNQERLVAVDDNKPSRRTENSLHVFTSPELRLPATENNRDLQESGITLPEADVEFPGIMNMVPRDDKIILNDPVESGSTNKAENKIEGTDYLKSKSAGNLPPASIDDAITNRQKAQNKKLSYLVYITPSRSYRRLNQSPSNSVKSSGGPLALNYFVDVNKVVRYNPGTGVEAGVSFMYNITDKLKVATGVQFNIRQYSLEAYIAPGDMSTIALTNRSGGADTINSYAVYRTSNGYLATELVNRYYEVSLPVGLVWQVIGNQNIQLNLAASVQPTYLINRNAYLLSTDFKNYTVNPGLMKSWNINTNLEAYISFKSGDFKWQLGPQFRYQNLPTFISRYPIRENLIDYGVKIGVTKNLK